MNKHVHVVAHTHWDRAWYWPFERFRISLVDCVKAVVRELRAHPDYLFTFDGQTLMLEDYLEVCPEDRAFLQQCAREERIRIGPMYVLSDLYCTGGEALVRNLLIGAQWCRAFGAEPARVLHMPDTFGIIPSIPMIASGLGMRAFTFMRGMPCEASELVHFRARIGPGGAEKILAASIALHGEKAKEKEVVVDTTTQEKNITFPTDTKLAAKIVRGGVKRARRHGIV